MQLDLPAVSVACGLTAAGMSEGEKGGQVWVGRVGGMGVGRRRQQGVWEEAGEDGPACIVCALWVLAAGLLQGGKGGGQLYMWAGLPTIFCVFCIAVCRVACGAADCGTPWE